jgi:DNA polymerase-1
MKVLLVDGSAIAHRSFHAFARNPLRTSAGEETSVAFGFLATLLRWLERYRPEAAAVVFDPPGPTHRHALYAAYKANRPATPEGLVAQLPRLHQALAALRLPVVQLEGWEADDVLATLARGFEARGAEVFLASGDKDFRQLLSERVRMVRPQPGLGADDEIGPAELRRDAGLRPEEIVEAMALSGDAVDGVPGVAGVGEKTAAALVREHGSLEGLYARLDGVRPALREKLAAGRRAAFLSRDLVRLRTDAPVDADPAALAWTGPDLARLRALLRELEFYQLLRQLPAPPRATPPVAARLVEDEAALADLAADLAGLPALALHLETTGAPAMRAEAVALGIAAPGRVPLAVRLAAAPPSPPPDELDLRPPASPGCSLAALGQALGPILADPRVVKVGEDLKRAAVVLGRHGIVLAGPYFDVSVASYVLDPVRRQHGAADLAVDYLEDAAAPEPLADAGDRRRDPRTVPAERLGRMVGARAELAWRLRAALAPRLASAGLEPLFRDVEMPLAAVLADMERSGVGIDAAALEALARSLQERTDQLAEEIFRTAGRRFNLHSPAQLAQVLFEDLGLVRGRRTRGGWSTDTEALERLAPAHPIARLVLEHRQLAKLRSTYAEALPRLVDPVTGRIHTCFHQTVASTGRLSSSDPNLQNIPVRSELGRSIRAAFVPADAASRLVAADYSQIELRLLAHISEDPTLVAAFASGEDVHVTTAARIHGVAPAAVTPEQRAAAKTINFGVIYGMGARGLAERLGIEVDAARQFIADYFASYPEVRRCTQDLVERARRTGCATTLLGRRLRLPEIASAAPERRAAAERVAVNAPIQGSAADLVKVAMVRVHAALREHRLAARMVLQVHDELVFDVPAAEVDAVVEIARREMQEAIPLRVPVVVDVGVGRTWAEAHR